MVSRDTKEPIIRNAAGVPLHGIARPKPPTLDQQLATEIAKFHDDPLGYVMFMFPWDTNLDIQMVELPAKYHNRFPNCKYGPDEWACDFLDQWGDEIKKRGFDGRHAVPPIQFTTASGHGIGKTTLVGWIVKFILDTRPMSVGTVTANTAEQLKTKTWAEIGKWHYLSMTRHWFSFSSGRGSMALKHVDPEFAEKWKCTAQTCKEENSEAFAGQHAASATSFYIFDEASAIPDKIFEVREGGTTDGEPMTFDFGNPTRNSGRFNENCVGRFKDEYIFRQIDSRSVAITSKERLQRWIDTYGIDSDFVKVRILGQFPSAGSIQFIAGEDVRAAMTRELGNNRYKPVIIGVDVARFGDDHSVIYPRVGTDARSFPPDRYQGIDGIQLAGRIIEKIKFFVSIGFARSNIHVFIDGTGGYGGSPADHLRHNGWDCTEINFSSAAMEDVYYRRGDNMWGRMREAIRNDLCLPPQDTPAGGRLQTQLTQREYGFTLNGNKIHLESKKDLKKRLGADASPDDADALALTFAVDVAPLNVFNVPGQAQDLAQGDYDPYKGF